MVVELVDGLHINIPSFTYGCRACRRAAYQYVKFHQWLWSLSKGCILIFQVSPMVVELVEGLHINMSCFTNGCGACRRAAY